MSRKNFLLLFDVLGPVAAIVTIAAAWVWAIDYFQVPRYLLPPPAAVGETFMQDYQKYLIHSWHTLKIILIGFFISVFVGVVCAYFIVNNAMAELILYPILLNLQFIPKTIVAPLLIVWFGIGIVPKSVLVFLMTLFPILLESVAGFRNIDHRLYYLTRSMGATRWQELLNLKIPAGLPFIFAGMKTSVIYAITAAIVAEYVGSNEGIGFLILTNSTSIRMPETFAAIIVASVLGVSLSALMLYAERRFLPWKNQELQT